MSNGYGYGYRRYRARYMPEQPISPWAHFLGGIGTGVTESMDRIMREKERKRSMASQVLESVIQGTDPMLFGTEEAGALFEQMGISKQKGISELRERAKNVWAMRDPEIGPPRPRTMQSYAMIKEQETEEKQKEAYETGLQRKIKEKDILAMAESNRIREEMARNLVIIQKEAEEGKYKIEDINVNFKTGAITINRLTPYEEEKALKKEEVARGKTFEGKKEKYDNAVIAARNFRLSGMTKLSAILRGEPINLSEELADVRIALREMKLKEPKEKGKEELEAMNPQKRFDHLRLEYNKIIGAHNKKLKSLSSGLGLKEIDKLNLIGSTLEEIKPVEPIKDEQKRGVIITPIVPKEPTAEEIEAQTDIFMSMGLVDTSGNPMNRDQAKELAKKFLAKK